MHYWSHRLPRIAYRAPIWLLGQSRTTVDAQTENISEGGVFVVTPRLLPLHSRVTCDVEIEGSRRCLTGHVAWAREASAEPFAEPPGMGIEFDDIRNGDAEFLRTCVANRLHKQHPVKVWLPGLMQQATARAVLSANGVVLSTPLPAFQLGSKVLFNFAGSAEELVGKLGRVHVTVDSEHAVPVLHVELAVEQRLDDE
jgi:Tfp pilus assembly protein PilZ